MLKILRFNWRRYILTIAACSAGFLLFDFVVASVLRWIVFMALCVAVFWMLTSLIVSHWVYDRSDIYDWNWMADWFHKEPTNWTHIHAGLDDSSAGIKAIFPRSAGTVFDIFDEKEMTEEPISEARKDSVPSGTRANFRDLPVGDQSFEAIFLIFAAHEIRRAESRDDFFKELYRISPINGCVLILEHLRDWKNFLAFGPGFLHFLGRREWLRLAKGAGFTLEREGAMTPFVRVFLLRKDL